MHYSKWYYVSLFPPGSIMCQCCGSKTQFSHWNDGSSPSTQPRILHDTYNILLFPVFSLFPAFPLFPVYNVVLLVSAVYVCDNIHKLLAHDEILLQRFPTYRMLPFILLSRTGFTTNLVNMCTSLCTHGMNFYSIETCILERRLDAHARQHKMLNLHNTLGGTFRGRVLCNKPVVQESSIIVSRTTYDM